MDDSVETKLFGFWIYLLTDLLIFTVLFAAFIVLRDNTFDGPVGRELFHVSTALQETLLLLVSTFTCSIAMFAVHRKRKTTAVFWFLITIACGFSFLCIEWSEFSQFVHKGASWRRSGFLSSFFTLVGTHGLHVSIGLLWMAVCIVLIMIRPLEKNHISKIWRMALFWHFLDFVWIFIFSIVYGMGYLI